MNIISAGQGSDLVVLHGWGMNSKIWEYVQPFLQDYFRVHWVDLPGHGQNYEFESGTNIDDWAQAVLAAVPAGSAWLGWSLGATIALQAMMLAPQQVRKLVMVAGTPKFIQSEDWPHGMEAHIFDGFVNLLAQNADITMRQFMVKQVLETEGAGTVWVRIKEIFREREPQYQALQLGLRFLRETDLRDSFSRYGDRIRVILGSKDLLVPYAVHESMQKLAPKASVVTVQGGGHLPFAPDVMPFVRHVLEFLL